MHLLSNAIWSDEINAVCMLNVFLLWLQTPGPPFVPDETGKGVNARIIFVQHGATLSSEDNLLMGAQDEVLSTLGQMQANKAAELVMDLKVRLSPSLPSSFFACRLHFMCCAKLYRNSTFRAW